ncbi:MAG TPA: energy transducer TonB, partial [Aggregicoccus sp.]|nr:energy transducer TonB [Aggregicoccus sp.]
GWRQRMFKSVIEKQGLKSGRFGTGAFVSVAVHAGLVLGVLWLTAGPAPVEVKPPGDLTLVIGPQKPKVAYGHAQPRPAVRPQPRKDLVPRRAPTTRPPEATPPAKPEPAHAPVDEGPRPRDDGLLGGHPLGDPNSIITGVPYVPGGGVGGPPTGEDVMPMGPGMTPPRLVSGPALAYTREALEARVEGTLIVKCVITREGETEDCRVLKGLPHLSESVLGALEARRYTPVTFQGRPVSVSYHFNVKLTLPQ